MKVELSIKDDKELRNHIKDVIKGEVTSITRSEIRTIIKEVFSEKYGEVRELTQNPEAIIRQEMRELIKKDIATDSYGHSSFIRNIAKEEVSNIVKNVMSKGI